MVLEDDCDRNTHAIGINRGLNNIHDCMKTHKVQLNLDNILKCYGSSRFFNKFRNTVEFRDNKVPAK